MSGERKEGLGLVIVLGVCVLLGVTVAVLGRFTPSGDRPLRRALGAGGTPPPAELPAWAGEEGRPAGAGEGAASGEGEDAFALNYKLERDRARSAQMEALEALASAAEIGRAHV